MKRFIVTSERNSEGWEFGSYGAVILDAESVTDAAAAYAAILSDSDSGIESDDGERAAIDSQGVGVCEMVPLGELVGTQEFIASGPDRKHSSEALDILFRYYGDPVTVRPSAGSWSVWKEE